MSGWCRSSAQLPGGRVSVPIAEKVAHDQVTQISPANSTPDLGNIGWEGVRKYFGLTAPNHGQEGGEMDRVIDAYVGADTAAFLYISNPYGEGLAEAPHDYFEGETVGFVG